LVYANVGDYKTLAFVRKGVYDESGTCGSSGGGFIPPEKILQTAEEVLGAVNQIRSIAEHGVCACQLALFGEEEGHAISVLFYNSEKGLLTCVISDPNSYLRNNQIKAITYDTFQIEKGYIATAFVNIFQSAGVPGINVIEYPLISTNLGKIGTRLGGICASELDIIIALLRAISCGTLKYKLSGIEWSVPIPTTNYELMEIVFDFAENIKPEKRKTDTYENDRWWSRYDDNVDEVITALLNPSHNITINVAKQVRRNNTLRRRSKRSKRKRRSRRYF
tara:strand:- start:450 stop:1283 length:834 start_codon:yes stop_codon:yes gene_type:complete